MNLATSEVSKPFKKGDRVTLVKSWDGFGTFTHRACLVGSAGPRQIHLIDATTGETVCKRFYPEQSGDRTGRLFHTAGIIPAEKAVALAADFIERERARYAQCLSGPADRGYQDPGYQAAVKASIAKLHEPRALDYHIACKAVRA